MRPRALVTIAFLALLAPRFAAASAWLLEPREYYSEVEAGRFSADTYHLLDSGDRVSNGSVFEERSLTFRNELGWKRWLSFGLSAPLKSATYAVPRFGFERTETGLGDLDVSFKGRIKNGATAIALQGDWVAPLGYARQSAAALGTGRQRFEGRVLVGGSFPSVNAFVDVSGGYRYWYEQFAPQAVGSAVAGFWVGSSILALGRYDGAIAIGNGDRPQDEFDAHLAGPELRYRVDDRLDVYAGSRHTVSDKNVQHVDEVYIGVAFRQTKLDRLRGIQGNQQRP